MASSRPSPPPPSKPLELELTLISAKHLKNVNWRHGDLKPYAVAYLDPDRRAATKSDDSGSTKPVWNERLTLPLPPSSALILTVDLFHSKPSETPKPLVGSARAPLTDLIDLSSTRSVVRTLPITRPSGRPQGKIRVMRAPLTDLIDLSSTRSVVRTLPITRPSGRPQGKIRVMLALTERPYPPEPNFPPSPYYYSVPPPAPAPAPAPVRDYRSFSPPLYRNPNPNPSPQYAYGGYSADPYYSSTPGYYAPPAPTRPYYDSRYGGPSAPVDYSSYEQKPRSGGRMGMGAGLAVGAVAGALGGLALEEGLKHEEERVTERVESDLAARDDYSDYRADY